MEALFSPEIYKWIVLPMAIFLARIVDVSLGTIRIIMISKGKKELAMLIGFFEVTLWLLIAAKAIQHVDNILYVFAYAGGFAAGSYVGILLDEKIALGKISVRLILQNEPYAFIDLLKNSGYGVTYFEANGTRGKAWVIYSIMNRRKFERFDRLAMEYHPKAFICAEEVKIVREGIFHPAEGRILIDRIFPTRKSK